MASKANANAKTLFHLVPTNQDSHDALFHPDNKRFVSPSSQEGDLGLEVGYHVPSAPGGHIITRLGRNSDLILRETSPKKRVSAIHVSFELNPTTHLILLSVRSKYIASVSFQLYQGNQEQQERITGDGVILYGQDYDITIASYTFTLVWRILSNNNRKNASFLKTLAVQGYEKSLQQWQDARSRDRPSGFDNSEVRSWHFTRLRTAKEPTFNDIEELREAIGSGGFGTVYKAFDQITGHVFAIKVVDLAKHQDFDAARALLHREIKTMEVLHHDHIIDYLGHQNFHTLNPEIFMPLLDGNLTSLSKIPGINHNVLCDRVLEQILAALDYLDSKKLIHRDIKPDNILYSDYGEEQYVFQLADFGLANYSSLATTFCGTCYYQAPELWPAFSKITAAQSSKIDVWSLVASLVAIHSLFPEFPPRSFCNYDVILDTLRAAILRLPKHEAMARLHPDRRASAAQLLVLLFNGKGLTTPRSKVPPIQRSVQESPHIALSKNTEPSNDLQPRNDLGTAPKMLREIPVIYPPPQQRHHRPHTGKKSTTVLLNREKPATPQSHPIRMHNAGVAKRHAGPANPRTAALDKRLDRRQLPVIEKRLHQQQRPDARKEMLLKMPGMSPP